MVLKYNTVALTGHTKGLGKAIYDLLINSGYIVDGFSRTNGFDVNDANTYKTIIDNNYDIVINNTFQDPGQLNLLKYVYDHWKDRDKIIINVGSHASDYKYRGFERLDYSIFKRALEDYSNWITKEDIEFRSMLFKPAFMDTENGQHGPEHQIMSTEYCASVVKFMIESPYKFKDITLVGHKQ